MSEETYLRIAVLVGAHAWMISVSIYFGLTRIADAIKEAN